MQDRFLVVQDPNGTVRAGSMVGARAGELLRRGGCVVLPVVDVEDRVPEPGELFGVMPFGDWGLAFENGVGTRGGGVVLVVRPDTTWLHWAALIEPIRPGQDSSGAFRLIANGGRAGLLNGALAPAQASPVLGLNGPRWIYGSSQHSSGLVGAMGIQLFGSGRNILCRELWVAQAKGQNETVLPGW